MTKLKPCPFCGGEATMWDDGIYMPVIDPDTGAVVDCRDEEPEGCVIECKNCPAQIVENKKTGESEAELKQRAIKAWNRRDGEQIMKTVIATVIETNEYEIKLDVENDATEDEIKDVIEEAYMDDDHNMDIVNNTYDIKIKNSR